MPLNVQKVKWGEMTVPAGASASRGRVVSRPAIAGRVDADELFAAWILGPAARVPAMSLRVGLQAVLFDLDGVLVDTAEFHYLAWKRLAEELGLAFGRRANYGFRGVGRMECLDKLLGSHKQLFVGEEKRILAERKNGYYLELIQTLGPRDVLAGVRELIVGLRGLGDGGVRLAVVSASRNARLVLERLQMDTLFDAIIDGADVTRGKPDPQGFLLAAERLRVKAVGCVVVEDAEAGVAAGMAAGMKTVGVGEAAGEADVRVGAIGEVEAGMLEGLVAGGVALRGGASILST